MKKYIIVLFIFIYSSIIKGSEITGFEFLNLPVDAKYASTGGCDFGTTGDLAALFDNPAALQTKTKDFGFSYGHYIEGIQQGYGAFAMPKYKGNVGIGINYLNYGTFDQIVKSGDTTSQGTFSAQSMVTDIGYSRTVKDNVLGISLKAIYFNLAGWTSTAIAIDAGWMVNIKKYEGLTLGATLHNVGFQTTKIDTAGADISDKLPFSASLGGSYLLFNKTALLSAQINLPITNEDTSKSTLARIDKKIGIEWYATSSFIVRAGYSSAGEELNMRTGSIQEAITGLSFGIGIKTNVFTFDYAIIPMGVFGVVNHISFSRSIANPPKSEKKLPVDKTGK